MPRTTPWTAMPKAAAILASCAANPPRRQTFRYRFGETDTRYVGERVKRLRQLYRNAQPEIDTPAWREWLRLDPQTAIAEAVQAGAKKEAA